MSRYWLVKVAESEKAERLNQVLRQFEGVVDGIEVVEIVPESRESNWMERAIAANYAKEVRHD